MGGGGGVGPSLSMLSCLDIIPVQFVSWINYNLLDTGLDLLLWFGVLQCISDFYPWSPPLRGVWVFRWTFSSPHLQLLVSLRYRKRCGGGLYFNVLYCTVQYCIVLYCTVLYCTVLYHTVKKIHPPQ